MRKGKKYMPSSDKVLIFSPTAGNLYLPVPEGLSPTMQLATYILHLLHTEHM